MKKSGDEVLMDIYAILKDSELIAMLSGELYMDGTMRPLNSTKEDAILIFKAGLDGQIQDGAVTLNVYVHDFDSGAGGKTKNIPRTVEISKKANELFNSKVIDSYRFWFGNTVQTYREEKIEQHFVSIDLRFRMTTF